MVEKMIWTIVYGIRGGVHAVIFVLLSAWLVFISGWLYKVNEASSLALMSIYIAKGIYWLALSSLAVAAIVWLATWISDYRAGYLPNWIRSNLY